MEEKYTGEISLKEQYGKNILLSKELLIEEQYKEIERLNNIIEELGRWLKEKQDEYIIEKGQCDNSYSYDLTEERIYAYQDILDKLQELKERK